MGQKQSRDLPPIPDMTDITELSEDSPTGPRSAISSSHQNIYLTNSSDNNCRQMNNFENYPIRIREILAAIDAIERNIDGMTRSDINLYYSTFKDELHNNWQKIYSFKSSSDPDNLKQIKIDIIERIKHTLQKLNDRVLK